jgi:carboxyl-terminal processing protease
VKGYLEAAHRPGPGVAAGLCLAAALAVTAAGCAAGQPGAGLAGGTPPACSHPRGRGVIGPGKPKPTTVTTIGQAYSCVFRHHYAGPVLDDRVLLAAAFAALTRQLDRLGLDQPGAKIQR